MTTPPTQAEKAVTTIRLNRWSDFAGEIQSIRDRYERTLDPMFAHLGQEYRRRNDLLFRGQADEEWPLATTLERQHGSKPFSLIEYLECAVRHSEEIESFTGASWKIPLWRDLQQQVETHATLGKIPAYDFLIYLRHHGFPSPLLDWTASPYVAAFFAYAEPGTADRAVFCFVDTVSGLKGSSRGSATIKLHGPFVRTDKRHFAQRARYTTCTRFDSASDRAYFCRHEEAPTQAEPGQDILIKIILPAADRLVALRALNDFNINHFTLFQSEDSLVAAIASRVFDLDD